MSRSSIVLIVTLAFLLGVGLLAFRLLTQNDMWVQQPYNAHIAGSSGLAQAGDIVDRYDQVLAHTDESEQRIYHQDETTR